ncbi:hypothetical protein [Photobacterium damselae]|uniref:hypothetical protein n=1 Tax=Photobacterium damselae TaxID=38293 RepID=UPI001F1A4179|nr:hypothetical protein [Photobacterium damselae]UKA04000.1 hypothetical protein IHC89_15845 [Photobacterium damselae subsp. damselae]
MKKSLLLMSLLLPVMTVSAVEIETFPVSMDVLVPQTSTSFEIVANKTNFIALYDVDNNKFKDLVIPFKVVSKTVSEIDYNIQIAYAKNICADSSMRPPSSNIVNGVELPISIKLDSKIHDIAQPNYKGENYGTTSGLEREHKILVSFSRLPQTNISQECQGALGLLAQLGNI